jgi:hypothetical protein
MLASRPGHSTHSTPTAPSQHDSAHRHTRTYTPQPLLQRLDFYACLGLCCHSGSLHLESHLQGGGGAGSMMSAQGRAGRQQPGFSAWRVSANAIASPFANTLNTHIP